MRSGSDFWASARPGNTSQDSADSNAYRTHHHNQSGESFHPFDDGDEDDGDGDGDGQGEDGRHTPQPRKPEPVVQEDVLDEEGAHAAFVAGMIWALSRRLLPGPPYAPGCHGDPNGDGSTSDLGVRWRLEECLRFATELASRRAHARPTVGSGSTVKERSEWDGLGEDMRKAGWFD